MKHTFFATTFLAAALPAFAATSCPSPEILAGTNCTISAAIGWAIAGLGTDSVFNVYVPPNATGPVNFHIASLGSSLGNAYTGYFGVKIPDSQSPGGELIVSMAEVLAGIDIGDVHPGELLPFSVTQVCWDPTCTAAAPAGAIPNMFSMQILVSSPNSSDVNFNDIQMVVRFLNGTQVTYETQETALIANSIYSIFPGVNLGATPAGRYVFDGAAVTLPYDAISVSNLNNPGPLSATLMVKNEKGDVVATAPIPAIPAGGAAGYLVIGRFPGDTLGLLPSTTTLPAGSDGIFHGILEVGLSGQTAAGRAIVLAQEYNGNTMLNLPIFRSGVR